MQVKYEQIAPGVIKEQVILEREIDLTSMESNITSLENTLGQVDILMSNPDPLALKNWTQSVATLVNHVNLGTERLAQMRAYYKQVTGNDFESGA